MCGAAVKNSLPALKALMTVAAIVLLHPAGVVAAPDTSILSLACLPGKPVNETIEACTKVLSDPDIEPQTRANALVIRGDAHFRANEFDLARPDFEEARKIKDFPALTRALGQVYMVLGKTDEAAAEYTKLIDAGPATAELYSARGGAYQNAGRFDDSIADFNKVLALKPNDLLALNNRAAAYWKKGDLAAAIKDLDAVLAINPDMPIALINRCHILTRQGHFDEGLPSCDRAEQLDPNNYFLLTALGAVRYDAGQFESAIAYCNRSLKLMPRMAPALYLRALAKTKLGMEEESKADMAEAIQFQPDIVAMMARSGMK
jgi:tetratricopeptide (TPR) repeat protein